MNAIRGFNGQYAFLSNFYASPIEWCGHRFPTAEHLFQAHKADSDEWFRRIAAAPTAREAKVLGRQVPLVRNWERRKVEAMAYTLSLKFDQNPDLAERLAATGTALLVEGNTWHDQFWGDCQCEKHWNAPGVNALGILLMRERL